MTRSTSSANEKSKRASFFLRELANGKIQFLLWMVLLFMLLPVISIYEMTGFSDTVFRDGVDKLRAIATPMYAGAWAMLAAGLISGIASFSIFHDKKKAFFYLGLPVTRNELFAARTLTGAVPAVAAYLVNLFVSILIFASNTHFGFIEILPAFAKLAAQTLLLFFWTYAFTVLAASVTSRGGANVMLAVWTFAFLPVYQFCLMLITELCAPNAYFPNFDTEVIFVRFNPVVRLALLVETMGDSYERPYPETMKVTDIDFYASFEWYETALILLASVAVIVAAMFILRKRPAENAGESAAFFKVGELIKLSALIPAGVCFGAFFNELFGIVGFFFGIVWGVFVVFLLLNLLLYRSGKKLFVGAKAAIVVAVLVVLAIILSLIVGAHIENRTYTVENTKSVTVRVSPFGEVKLDPEKCVALLAHIESVKTGYTAGTTSIGSIGAVPELEYYIIDYRQEYVAHYSFKLIPKFGIGISKSYAFDEESEKILFDAIRASSQDGIDLFAKIFPADEYDFNRYGNSYSFSYDGTPLYPKEFNSNPEKYKTVSRDIAAKLAERRVKDFLEGRLNGFTVGSVEYRSANGNYVRLPIYITDGDILDTEFCTAEEFLATVKEMDVVAYVYYDNIEEWYEKYGEVVYKYMGDDSMIATITDKAQIQECFEASSGGYSGYGIYNREETNITFIFHGSYNGHDYTVSTSSLRGETPDFVYEILENYEPDWISEIIEPIETKVIVD